MRRALLILLGIAAFTGLQFELLPGHTYLQADTQSYVPVLERLENPGFLSRDLVATHPDVTYTIYDELTLFLHRTARLPLRTVLVIQQLFCRFAGCLGLFLLARALALSDLLSLSVMAIIGLGPMLAGPGVQLVEFEPVPRAFAFGLILLGAGLLAHRMPLLAGLFAGLAVVYDPAVGAPFWIAIAVALLFDRPLRPLLRPSLTVLAIFALLLANLAQLQPSVSDSPELFERLAPAIARIQQYRAGMVWVSMWAAQGLWICLALWAAGLWATAYLWARINRQMRWFLLLLPTLGIASIPFSFLALDLMHYQAIARLQPLQMLVYTLGFSLLAIAAAMVLAWRKHDFRRLVPLAAMSLWMLTTIRTAPPERTTADVLQMAEWSLNATWGGSMFLFPDAGRSSYPGMFRAYSERAVWVDWQTGMQANNFDSFADEWWRRWQDTMAGDFSAGRLQKLLALPIDYVVLQQQHELKDVKPAFATRQFLIYDAHELRNAKLIEIKRAS